MVKADKNQKLSAQFDRFKGYLNSVDPWMHIIPLRKSVLAWSSISRFEAHVPAWQFAALLTIIGTFSVGDERVLVAFTTAVIELFAFLRLLVVSIPIWQENDSD